MCVCFILYGCKHLKLKQDYPLLPPVDVFRGGAALFLAQLKTGTTLDGVQQLLAQQFRRRECGQLQ